MGNLYDSIMAGLTEAVADVEGQKPALRRRIVTVMPVKKYEADEVQNIRRGTGLSQKLFADYMGVSVKTVEAWEAGTNQPSGTASRILNMMELNPNLTKEFPFVKCTKE